MTEPNPPGRGNVINGGIEVREQTWYVPGFLITAVTGVILIDGDGPYLFLRASSCPECHLIGVRVLSGPSEILKLSLWPGNWLHVCLSTGE